MIASESAGSAGDGEGGMLDTGVTCGAPVGVGLPAANESASGRTPRRPRPLTKTSTPARSRSSSACTHAILDVDAWLWRSNFRIPPALHAAGASQCLEKTMADFT